MPLKQLIFDIIEDKDKKLPKAHRYFESFITLFIILSIIEIILESFQSLSDSYRFLFDAFEYLVVIIFTVEYLLRLWTADLKYPNHGKLRSRIKFITSGYGIIDLLAIIPFYLPLIFAFDLRFIRILRIFRLFRIFKLNRHNGAIQLLANILTEKKNEISITLFMNIILLLMSSTIMYNLENEVQPDKFPNIVETFWWAIATLTTVGYGDVFPVTAWGKLMSGVIATLGIGMVALPTGIISAGFIEKIQDKDKKKTKTKAYKYCPHCGEEIANGHHAANQE